MEDEIDLLKKEMCYGLYVIPFSLVWADGLNLKVTQLHFSKTILELINFTKFTTNHHLGSKN